MPLDCGSRALLHAVSLMISMKGAKWMCANQTLLFAVADLAIACQMALPMVARGEPGHPVGALVDGVLAREKAVFSGRFVYRRIAVSNAPKGDEVVADEQVQFSLMGDSWALRSTFTSGAPSIEARLCQISHNGSLVDYQAVDSSVGKNKGEVRRTVHCATLRKARPVDQCNEPPPFFAGTLWHKSTARYVEVNQTKARFLGIDEMDGMAVSIIEWEVPAEEIYDAFYAVNDLLKEGGVLRLFVAPDLGYTLPKIEHVAHSGKVQTVYRSRDFREVAEGLFFPREIVQHTNGADGQSGFTWKYVFQRIEGVNEPVDEDEFLVSLPEGTLVADLREPGRRGTILSRPIESDVLPEAPLLSSHEGDPKSWSGWRVVLLALNIVVVVVVGVWVAGRRWKLSRG